MAFSHNAPTVRSPSGASTLGAIVSLQCSITAVISPSRGLAQGPLVVAIAAVTGFLLVVAVGTAERWISLRSQAAMIVVIVMGALASCGCVPLFLQVRSGSLPELGALIWPPGVAAVALASLLFLPASSLGKALGRWLLGIAAVVAVVFLCLIPLPGAAPRGPCCLGRWRPPSVQALACSSFARRCLTVADSPTHFMGVGGWHPSRQSCWWHALALCWRLVGRRRFGGQA